MNAEMYQAGAKYLERRKLQLIEEIVGVCQVPAPPFQEDERAAYVAGRLRRLGAGSVEIDACGNVLGIYREPQLGEKSLLVTAHLDTVFPAGTNVQVKQENGRLYAPGVQDNSVSVATMILLVETLLEINYHPQFGLAFVANVGEEGLGDLRGMKYLFSEGVAARWDVGGVLVFDGCLGTYCHQGIASRRLEAQFAGPGGHSWGDYGRPSAIHAAGRAIAAVDKIVVPEYPRTTCNVGIIEGGMSVNVIAPAARMIIDLRSESALALTRLEQEVRAALQAAAGSELEVDITVVGDRPGGSIPADHPLVRSAIAVGKAHDLQPRVVAASTDANVPLSKGVPAVTTGVAHGGRVHSLDEYLDINSLLSGAYHALGLVLAGGEYVAGVA